MLGLVLDYWLLAVDFFLELHFQGVDPEGVTGLLFNVESIELLFESGNLGTTGTNLLTTIVLAITDGTLNQDG